jgi:hypothetical protein
LLLSIVLGLQTLWQKWRGEAVEGFTTVILVGGGECFDDQFGADRRIPGKDL